MYARFNDGYLWAEDGIIFIKQSFQLGIESSFVSYAGYLHVLPRIISGLSSYVIAPTALPYVFVWVCAGITAGGMAYIGVVARRYFPPIGVILFALIPVFAANSGEVWLSITNLQWVCAPVLAIMMWDATRSGARVLSVAKGSAAFILMTTGPFGLVFGVMVFFGLLIRLIVSHRIDTPLINLFIFFFGFSVQGWVVIRDSAGELSFSNIVALPWIPMFLKFAAGSLSYTRSMIEDRPDLAMLMGALGVGSVLVAATFVERRWRRVVILCLLTALIFWGLGVARLSSLDEAMILGVFQGSRYAYLPYVFTLWALVLTAIFGNHPWVKYFAILIIIIELYPRLIKWHCSPEFHPVFDKLSETRYLVHMPPAALWNFELSLRSGTSR
jgi:hypothetical protein